MTRIECSKCGEIIETSATAFVAPYVCDECELAKDFVSVIAPQPTEQPAELLDDTTSLIGDLTTQVEKYDTALTTANVLIADFNQKLTDSRAAVAERDETITSLTRRNIDLFIQGVELKDRNGRQSKLIRNLATIAGDQSLEIENLKGELAKKDASIALLNKENIYLRDVQRKGIQRRRQILEDFLTTRRELLFKKNRGLVARIFNR